MRINLIPEEFRPTRVSPLPYFPLIGLTLMCGIWLLTQFSGASNARRDLRESRAQYHTLKQKLKAYEGLANRKAAAETEAQKLRLKGALVTVLTRKGLSYSKVLQALAESTPADLRLTLATLDPSTGKAVIHGYGTEEKTDFEVTMLLRALNDNKTIRQAFTSVQLKFCNWAKLGERPIKRFSVFMVFRDKSPKPPAAEEGARGRG